MKKQYLCLLLFYCGQINGQKSIVDQEPEAEKYLKSLKAKFDKLAAYTLQYEMSHTDVNNKTTVEAGKYIGSKEKYMLETPEIKIINNGTTQWNIQKKDKEIQINTINPKKSKMETPMSVIKNYKTLFKYRVKDPISNKVIVLELIPLNKNNSIFKIDLGINVPNNQIVHSKFYDKSGSRINYQISHVEENNLLSKDFFDLKKEEYKGYEVLDLR